MGSPVREVDPQETPPMDGNTLDAEQEGGVDPRSIVKEPRHHAKQAPNGGLPTITVHHFTVVTVKQLYILQCVTMYRNLIRKGRRLRLYLFPIGNGSPEPVSGEIFGGFAEDSGVFSAGAESRMC